MSVTRRQKEVLDYLRAFIAQRGYSPSLEEIGAHFGLASPNAVFKHLQALERRGFIRRHTHSARSIEVLEPAGVSRPEAVALPLLGAIAAGAPIEALEQAEAIHVPADFTGRGSHYVLRVKGSSMIDAHIQEGDFIIVQETEAAANGDLVVALVDGDGATLKRYFREGGRIRLQPANPDMAPLFVEESQLRIRGIVVGIMRKYR